MALDYQANQFFLRPGESLDTYRARVTPLGGYGPTQQEVSSAAAKLGTPGTRNLTLAPSNQNAGAMINRDIASEVGSTIGSSGGSSQFGLALMDLLRQYQGLGTKPLAQQGFNAQEEQARRLGAPVSSDLVGASPQLQNQVRGAQVGALDPTVQGAERDQRTLSEQIRGLGDSLQQAQAIGKFMQDAELQQQEKARDLIFKLPTAVKSLPDDQKRALEKQAGLQKGLIDLIPNVGEDAKLTQIDLGDRVALIDAQGNTVKTFPKGLTPSQIADQKKDGTPSGYQVETNQRILESVNELAPKVNSFTVGTPSAIALSLVPGTDAANFKAQLEQLKANIGFGSLAQMREASKTGGALGNVSDRETALLTSTLGALSINQSPKEFLTQLYKIRDSIKRWEAANTASVTTGTSGTTSSGMKYNISP